MPKYILNFVLLLFLCSWSLESYPAEQKFKVIMLDSKKEIQDICNSSLANRNIFCLFSVYDEAKQSIPVFFPDWFMSLNTKNAESYQFKVPKDIIGFWSSLLDKQYFAFAIITPGYSSIAKSEYYDITIRTLSGKQTLDIDNSTSDYLWEVIGKEMPLADYKSDELVTFFTNKKKRELNMLHEAYLSAFDSVKSLDDIKIFEEKYNSNDPDNIIPRLAHVKQRLQQEIDDRRALEEHQQYINEFNSATTLEAIGLFEFKYANNDLDNLIQKLSLLKLKLKKQWAEHYHNMYIEAHSSIDFENFIKKFENNDPDHLVAEAKKRLPEIKRNEDYTVYGDRFKNSKTSSELQAFITDYEHNDPDHLIINAKKRLRLAIKEEQITSEKRNREAQENTKIKGLLNSIGMGAGFGLDNAITVDGFMSQFSYTRPDCNDLPINKGKRTGCFASYKIPLCPYGSGCEVSCAWINDRFEACTIFYEWLDYYKIKSTLSRLIGPPSNKNNHLSWNNGILEIEADRSLIWLHMPKRALPVK